MAKKIAETRHRKHWSDTEDKFLRAKGKGLWLKGISIPGVLTILFSE